MSLQNILRHTEELHCGSGEVELEVVVDSCTFLTQTYHHNHSTLTGKLKIVETQLEALDSSWIKGPVATAMPAQGQETVILLRFTSSGSQRRPQ